VSIILGTVAFLMDPYLCIKWSALPWLPWSLCNGENIRLNLYRSCQTTGWGGQPIKSPAHGNTSEPSTRLQPVTDHKRIRITFNGSVSDVLPWKFTPQQREVRVLPGETALAFYTATNKSSEDIIGVATYSVTPGQVAPYFSKIQCFCLRSRG